MPCRVARAGTRVIRCVALRVIVVEMRSRAPKRVRYADAAKTIWRAPRINITYIRLLHTMLKKIQAKLRYSRRRCIDAVYTAYAGTARWQHHHVASVMHGTQMEAGPRTRGCQRCKRRCLKYVTASGVVTLRHAATQQCDERCRVPLRLLTHHERKMRLFKLCYCFRLFCFVAERAAQ